MIKKYNLLFYIIKPSIIRKIKPTKKKKKEHLKAKEIDKIIPTAKEVTSKLRASSVKSPNFCTIWRMNSNFYLLATHFFKYTSNRFSISFKYYFFINYLFFFNNYTSSNRLDKLLFMSQKKI